MRCPSDRDLLLSFHLSGDLKDFEFFKYVIGIIVGCLDVDIVTNESKPQIPITSHLVMCNIKMFLGVSPLTSEISVLCLMPFICLFLPCTSVSYCLSCPNPTVSTVMS